MMGARWRFTAASLGGRDPIVNLDTDTGDQDASSGWAVAPPIPDP